VNAVFYINFLQSICMIFYFLMAQVLLKSAWPSVCFCRVYQADKAEWNIIRTLPDLSGAGLLDVLPGLFDCHFYLGLFSSQKFL
jgi:hypothetical protein